MNTKSKSNVASCWTLQLNLCTKLNLQNYAVDGCCTVQNFAKPGLAQLCTQINLRCIQRPAWRVIAHTSIFAQPILRHCNHMHIQPPNPSFCFWCITSIHCTTKLSFHCCNSLLFKNKQSSSNFSFKGVLAGWCSASMTLDKVSSSTAAAQVSSSFHRNLLAVAAVARQQQQHKGKLET